MSGSPFSLDQAFAFAVGSAVEASTPAMIDRLRPAVKAAVAEVLGELATNGGAPTYVPLKQAARIMSAHPKTVRKLINAGKLGRFTVEGQLRVKVGDIHAYMAREGQPSPTVTIEERAIRLLASTSK